MKKKGSTFVYKFEGKLYINLTNKCTHNCDFCIRKNEVGIEGYNLWLDHEPAAAEVIAQINQMGKGDVTFCGYGEPTMCIETLKEVAAYVKGYGGKVRVNTNGMANRYYERDVAAELAGLVDTMSISLNQATAEKYQSICHSIYGEQSFYDMLEFARASVEAGIDTVLSVVDVIPSEDIERCEELANQTGARLRVRAYQKD